MHRPVNPDKSLTGSTVCTILSLIQNDLDKAMTVTLKQIAEQVGKSVTTVSRALAGYDDVSKSTRQQVVQVAQALGYEPNATAQQLRRQRTDTVAIILPTFAPRFSDPFFSEFLAGAGNEAARHGFDLLVSSRAPGDEEETTYLKHIRGRRVDGFIIVRTRRQDPRIEILQSYNYPFVAFGRTEGPLNFPFIDEDSELGVRLMVDHLVQLGHRRIAWLGAPLNLMFGQYRQRGFINALATHGLKPDPALLREGDLTQRMGRQLAGELLDLRQRPTAIMSANDLMALGAMSAAQERGLIVGKQVTIAGFDDVPLAEHSHPPLTTVHQPVHRIGEMACDMLIKLIEGAPLPERQVLLKPELVVRASSGPVGDTAGQV
ncbi:MAG: LacI family DNA-binding transcriptional regulator [Anaerolineae bacterium]